jgi:type VI secretion system protein ImpM
MAHWQGRASETDLTSAPLAFGKLRTRGDFVRTPGYNETCRHFDSFLERSLSWANERQGKGWAAAFMQGGIVAFAYRPPEATGDASLLVGVMAPSHDSVGRRYPLVLAVRAPLAPFLQAPHVVPLVFADFFEAAAERLAGALRTASVDELTACVHALGPVPLSGVAEATALYEAWAHRTALSQVWAALFLEWGTTLPRVALHMVLASTSPFRGIEGPSVGLGLRLPLGGAAATALAFWVDVVRRAARWERTVPSVFWCPDDSLVLQLGDDLPPTLLGDLWGSSGESEQLFSLGHARQAADIFTLPAAVEALLAIDDAPVRTLLTDVGA